MIQKTTQNFYYKASHHYVYLLNVSRLCIRLILQQEKLHYQKFSCSKGCTLLKVLAHTHTASTVSECHLPKTSIVFQTDHKH